MALSLEEILNTDRPTITVKINTHGIVAVNGECKTTTPLISIVQELEIGIVRELLNMGPAIDFLLGGDRYQFKGYELFDVPESSLYHHYPIVIHLLKCPSVIKIYNIMSGKFVGHRGVITTI